MDSAKKERSMAECNSRKFTAKSGNEALVRAATARRFVS